jgi:hypothetical protein
MPGRTPAAAGEADTGVGAPQNSICFWGGIMVMGQC